ncbi:MAG: hypothetical protein KDA92_08075, partial [Planctomycetales bacterium]|nr:hypothetical protein [Planctomycetales bacterium]
MTDCRRSIVCAFMLSIAFLPALARHGQAQLANQKGTLRGHQAVFISVTTPQTDEARKQLGLVRESLERFIIERLTAA